MKGQQVVFSSGKDNWRTPLSVFGPLDQEFGFTLDVAADESNHLVPAWLGSGGLHEDALIGPWDRQGTNWCNPPYSKVAEFVAKAKFELACRQGAGVTAVLLLPARTDTRWWHDDIWDRGRHSPQAGVQVRFVKGRIRFGDPAGITANSAPFPSVVVVFGG